MENVESILPLSPMQRDILIRTLQAPELHEYVDQTSWTVRGNFVPEAFQAAWRQVIARHSTLRTAFFHDGLDEPVQVVRQHVELGIIAEDWRKLSSAEQSGRFQLMLAEDRRRDFVLTSAPLLRLHQCRLTDRTWRFLWSCHHLVLDGWSASLCLREVFTTYQALVEGKAYQPSIPATYQQYLTWLAQQDSTAAEAFWRRTLAGFQVPESPFSAAQGSLRVKPGHSAKTVTLPTELSTTLRQTARRLRISLNTLFEGAWAVLLSRYSGADDLVFGSIGAGRPADLPAIDETLGVFIRTVPLRARCEPRARTSEWLNELRRQEREARLHDFVSLDRITSWSQIPRGQRLFEHLFVFQNLPDVDTGDSLLGGLVLSDFVRLREGAMGYTLVLIATPLPEIHVELVHDPLVDAATAGQILTHYVALLEAMASDPDQPLGELRLMGLEERAAIVALGQVAARLPAQNGGLAGRFAEQVVRTPAAVAVTDGPRQLSYAELDSWANRVAHALRAFGVGPETRVGLCLDRSLELVVGLLGILKAGGAYVPLDPAYPADRLAYIIADAGVAVVLTRKAAAAQLPVGPAPLLLLDAQREGMTTAAAAGLSLAEWPDQVAYVIYTSGSTGLPKGVAVTHANVLRLFVATEAMFGFGPTDVWTLFHSIAFDFSVWELWGALLHGGRLIVVPYAQTRTPEEFHTMLVRERVTVLNQTPSAFRELIEADRASGVPPQFLALRYVIFGGEALAPALLKPWIERHGDTRPELVNMYGITETTVHVTARVIRREDADGEAPSRSLIGGPLEDLSFQVLDAKREPVPLQVAGEVYVGGAGVARGYLGRPGLTALRFCPDPFAGVPGARCYRSGDRARRGVDGEVEYLGRLDDQVKIRGFRIEPGEIETALRTHPGVRTAVVIAREDRPGDRRLVAYVVPTLGSVGERAGPTGSELRTYLGTRLPAHLVPSAFVALDAIPLTQNGKLDRRALPPPEKPPADSAGTLVAPRTPTEEVLARVWAEVLGLDRVGVEDDFFALGGDSVLAIQIVSRASRAGVRITPRQVFESPTVSALSRVAEPINDLRDQPAATQGPVLGPVPLIPTQHWALSGGVGFPDWSTAVLLDVHEPLDPVVLRTAIAHLIEHHDALRLRFERQGSGEWRQTCVVPGGPVPVEHVALPSAVGQALPAAIETYAAEARASLDPERGSLFRVVHFTTAAGPVDRLLLVCHRLVVDNHSWPILLEDLNRLYGQLRRGEPVSLPSKTTSFKAWAERLLDSVQSAPMPGEADFWLGQPWDQAGSWPPARSAGAASGSQTQTHLLDIDEATTQALLEDVPAIYGTQVGDALVAALARAVGSSIGGDLVLLELQSDGREASVPGLDASRTVGPFIHAFPILLEARPAGATPDDVGALLRSTKERLRAVPHHGSGFSLLRSLSQDPSLRSQLARIPAGQIGFGYLGLKVRLDSTSPDEPCFRPVADPTLPLVSPSGRSAHVLEVLAAESGGRLQVSWSHSPDLLDPELVRGIIHHFEDALRAVVVHCRTSPGGYTPSDFPLAKLSQDALDRVLGALGVSGRGRVEDMYPLTPLQQGILFHTLRDTAADLYTEEVRLRIRGPLDVEAFARAWQVVADTYPVLRTAFVWQGLEYPVQVVLRQLELPLEQVDQRPFASRQLPGGYSGAHSGGYELTAAPLMRITLIRRDDLEWEFVWGHHHLLLDGWSVPRVGADVMACYQRLTTGQRPALPPVTPFRNYVEWLSGQDPSEVEAFWRRVLEGFTDPIPVPAGRPSAKAGAPCEFGEERLHLSRATTQQVQSSTRALGLTMTTLFQGAWAILLSRYTGTRDVLFGNVISGRSSALEGVDEIVGMLINTLPVRLCVTGSAPALPWLHALQTQQAEARQFEYTPLTSIVRWSQVEPGRELFDTLFVFENYPLPATFSAGEQDPSQALELALLPVLERTNYPLAVTVLPGEELEIRITYDAKRYDAAAARRMAEHCCALAVAMAAGPDCELGLLPMLEPPERTEMLVVGASREASYPPVCVQGLFESQAAQLPEAMAVVCGADRLTYGALEIRANQLAHSLRAMGVGPEVRVGVCLEKSLDLVVAVLGVLKAGGAYVPLDPSYPADRLAYMLEDAGSPVLLTKVGLLERLSIYQGSVVCVDRDWPAIARASAAPPRVKVDPANLAYVVYTSGTTGRPKGVQVTHAALANAYFAWEADYGLRHGMAHLQMANVAFDVFSGDLVRALCSGGKLVLCPTDVLLTPVSLYDLMRQERVDAAEFVPAVLRALMEHLRSTGERLDFMRLLIAGSDIWPVTEYGEIRRLAGPETRCINSYGVAECTIDSSFFEGECGTAAQATVVPVGRPFPNTRLYVLDRYLEPVPVGVAGELYIGGAGCARGYLNRPGPTAEKFVPDSFGSEPGARLYRTGDRARWTADGLLEFLGRADDQVKIRGFRVEPGEIEAALQRQPGIQSAVVVAREDRQGGKRLVGYVVADPAAVVEPAAVRDALAAQLPVYMIPGAIVLLDSLPLTPNGKVDRRSLPIPDAPAQGALGYVAPRNPIEQALADIWAEVLELDRVGVEDDFFALGGHSLLVMRVVVRAREALGVELPIRALFEAPTVVGLAAFCDTTTPLASKMADTPGEVVPTVRDEMLERIERLSDAEVDQLLNTILR
jgi:amino acid adenylation domain-containing protein/non-ribosomal peptide synthase protein (TIGR01720 family)